jgi:type I restriction enzyme M protein
MAVKKSELYSSLWASCDSLRGGMDSSQYKDYILTLLFVKYVSDKFKGVAYGDIDVPEGGSFDDMLALIGTKNIGEDMDKIIAKLAEANNLRGVIDNAHFNDEDKLGKGKEMVDKLSELLGIFRDQMPDFSKNRADGDDIIGDAYEYLMRNFATESGKSKGQFYTPAEVSRILAKVVGIEQATDSVTLYDPACGSGSLLIRAAEAAHVNVAIWGQEKDVTTAGLARMNLVLHNHATAEVKGGYSTFSDPQYKNPKDESALRQFDFVVVNPPFSDKNWTHGLKEYGRFDGYGDRPPQKNGDFAWLMHIIKSLKRNGKAAVILPHGVLFRGNAEATIRTALIDKGYIKGIVGLPANLFYGTGIPACIIVIDKENADEREGIFMIDASRDFIKDGNKNRLRERDIYKIVTTFNERITSDPKYARFVLNEEIKVKNAYNLNISRYIDGGTAGDLQNIDGHLKGGIPSVDIESLSTYWKTFPKLQSALFTPLRAGFYSLAVEKDAVRDTVYSDKDFSAYADIVERAFENWKNGVDGKLRTIDSTVKPKLMIAEIAQLILNEYEPVTLINKYDAYEVLLAFWNDVMSDDVYMIVEDGYKAIRDIEVFTKTTTKKKKDGSEETKTTETGWEGKLVPKSLVIEMFFSAEQKIIDDTETVISAAQAELDEVIQNAEDDSVINEILSDKGALSKDKLKKELKARKGIDDEDTAILLDISEKIALVDEKNKLLKELKAALDKKTREQYPKLTDDQCMELLLERKWYRSLIKGIFALYTAVCHRITERITELVERYEDTLPQLEEQVEDYEVKVKAHLERMGFKW